MAPTQPLEEYIMAATVAVAAAAAVAAAVALQRKQDATTRAEGLLAASVAANDKFAATL
jgi:hypothetical protein